MVYPNLITTIESNSISTPHVLRVNISYVDVLNDHIRVAIFNNQSLALNYTGATLAHDAFVASYRDSRYSSSIIRARYQGTTATGSSGSNGELPGRGATRANRSVGLTAFSICSALRPHKVPRSVNYDCSGNIIRNPIC